MRIHVCYFSVSLSGVIARDHLPVSVDHKNIHALCVVEFCLNLLMQENVCNVGVEYIDHLRM